MPLYLADLGEPESLFSLREPKGFDGVDSRATCFADGSLYRLQGHATFDLVFGYADLPPSIVPALE